MILLVLLQSLQYKDKKNKNTIKVNEIKIDSKGINGNSFERIGEKESFVTHKVNGEKYVIKEPVKDHEEALKIILQQLVHKDYGVIKDLSEINAVGHRLVHGGEIFNQSVLITEDVIEKYQSCSSLAPLHNPATILGIRACQKEMPSKWMAFLFGIWAPQRTRGSIASILPSADGRDATHRSFWRSQKKMRRDTEAALPPEYSRTPDLSADL